jgi:uncharacterized protein
MARRTVLILVILLALLAACRPVAPRPEAEGTMANMANPASVYCEENGGKLEIRDEAGGQVGYCIFPDGSECEEWAYMRGECAPGGAAATPEAVPSLGMPNPASVYCTENEGTLEIRTDSAGGEYGVCVFPDGSECDEWAFFRGDCKAGAPAPEAGMANPASVYCAEKGGTSEIREGDGGEVGYCVFADGSECEEWAFYRGQCQPGGETPQANMVNPASAYCAEHGGTSEIRKGDGGEVGYCVFADGSECEEWAFFRGECQAGN